MFCFPGNALVETRDGKTKKMSELQVGEEIKSYRSDGSIVYSPVVAFLHRNRLVQANFYKIFLSGSRSKSLVVSGKHILFKKGLFSKNSDIASFASEIHPGDVLLTESKQNGLRPIRVVQVTMVTEQGLYAPLTNEGTLFVNDVLASCYAHWPSHKMAHLAMAPFRVLVRIAHLLGPIFNHFSPVGFDSISQRKSPETGIHWYSNLLLGIAQRIGISSLLAY